MTAKVKALMSKKLIGREVAAIILTDAIQYSLCLPRIYTDSEVQNAYNSLDGRPEEHPEFNKWKQIEDFIPQLSHMADLSILNAGYDLNLILSKISLCQLRWLADGCENEWKNLIDTKSMQLSKYGCMPHVANIFNPLYFNNGNDKDAKFISNLYKSAIRHIKYYIACTAICEIINDIIKIDMKHIITSNYYMLRTSIGFFNNAIQNQLLSINLVKDCPGIKPLLPNIPAIDEIDLEDYIPSKQMMEKAKARLEGATKDIFLDTCKNIVEEFYFEFN